MAPLLRSVALGAVGLAALCSRGAPESVFVLPPTVVQAYSLSDYLESLPGSSDVLDARDIEKSLATDAADLLLRESAVFSRSFSGNGTDAALDLRGYGENSGQRVLILLDGQPLNRPDMSNLSWLEVPLIAIERVEVLRGSHSVRFGNHAVGGVINFITRLGPGDRASFLEGQTGADGLAAFRAYHRDSFRDTAFAVSVDRRQSDGWREHAASEASSVSLNLGRQFTPSLWGRFGFSYLEDDAELPGPLSERDFRLHPRRSTTGRMDIASSQGRLTAIGGFSTPGLWSGEARLALSRRDWDTDLSASSRNHGRWDRVTGGIVLTADSAPGRIDVGMEGQRDTYALDLRRTRTAATADLERTSGSAFAYGSVPLGAGWSLTGGGRVESVRLEAVARDPDRPALEDRNFRAANTDAGTAAQIGLLHRSPSGFTAWVRYDRLYRFPATDEVAAYQLYPLSEPFNAALGPESGHNVECGTETRWRRLSARLNVFHQQLEDTITFDYIANLNRNLGTSVRTGVESSLAWHADTWTLRLTHTWIDLQWTDAAFGEGGGASASSLRGHNLPLVPENQVTLLAEWRPLPPLVVSFDLAAASEAVEGNDFENRADPLPAWWLAGAALQWEPRPWLRVFARVTNLLDEHYATVKYEGTWYPANGRQWRAGIALTF